MGEEINETIVKIIRDFLTFRVLTSQSCAPVICTMTIFAHDRQSALCIVDYSTYPLYFRLYSTFMMFSLAVACTVDEQPASQ